MPSPGSLTSPSALAEARRIYADGFNASQTLRFIGARISFPTDDRVRIDLDVQPHHRGGMGTSAVNGGIIAAMVDLGLGCTAALLDPTRRSATMQISISFEQALKGDVLVAESWIDRAGSRVLFSSAVIKDGQGQVCARGQGVVRVTDLPWDGASPGIM